MRYLVGSRALKINHSNSDYDVHDCRYGTENIRRISFMETEAGDDVDLHEFIFMNKFELLAALRSNSFQALLYKEFRDFWEITESEAIQIIEYHKSELRPYELLYYKQQLLHEPISQEQLVEAYEKYKNR